MMISKHEMTNKCDVLVTWSSTPETQSTHTTERSTAVSMFAKPAQVAKGK